VLRLTVTTPDQEYEFVVSGVDDPHFGHPRPASKDDEERYSISSGVCDAGTSYACEGFEKSEVSTDCCVLSIGHLGWSAAQTATNPFGAATIVNLAQVGPASQRGESRWRVAVTKPR
jgi:hypothetical protein